MKFVASLLASQLPKDIQSKVRDKVKGVDDNIEGADGRRLITTIKRELVERGYPLDLGNKDFEMIKKVAVLSDAAELSRSINSTSDDVELPPPSDDTVAYFKANPRGAKWGRQSKQTVPPARGCYICGESHMWKYCPEKRCPGCGERGHTLKECLNRGGAKRSKILNLGRRDICTELSVLLPMK